MNMNRTGNRCATLAASYVLLALAAQSAALAQAAEKAPASAANQSTYVAPLNAKEGASAPSAAQPAAGTPAASTTPGQGSAHPQPAAPKTVHIGGRPPVVIGPAGQSTLNVTHKRVAMPGEKAAFSIRQPKSSGIRVGFSRIGSEETPAAALAPAATVVATIAIGGSVATARHEESASPGVHTWTRDGSTLASAPTAAPVDAQAGIVANAVAGSSLTSSKMANAKTATPPTGDIMKRIGGMGSVMTGRTATASAAE